MTYKGHLGVYMFSKWGAYIGKNKLMVVMQLTILYEYILLLRKPALLLYSTSIYVVKLIMSDIS